MVVDLVQELLWVVSLISIIIYSIRSLLIRKKSSMSVVVTRDAFSPSSGPPWNNEKCFYGGWRGDTVSGESKRQREEFQEAIHKGLHDRNASHVERTGSGSNIKMRKRPSRLVLPESMVCSPLMMEFGETDKKAEIRKEVEVEGRDYYLACKKGKRDIMEDDYGVMLDISGDPKQAFFAVIDGHGGRAAADYVAENLGKNIVRAIESVAKLDEADSLEQAIRGGYSATDEGFLSKGVVGGACTASVLMKDGQVHVANVGDCRVVLSRTSGVAEALTTDHRPSREDERFRIQNSGGYVNFRNGVWRVQGSLAISRAIGDMHLKEWIISQPDITTFSVTSDSEFLILASDGLWDKVSDQEAVDVVSREKNNLRSCCKKLVDMSSSRGNLDDITVMVINLQSFVAPH